MGRILGCINVCSIGVSDMGESGRAWVGCSVDVVCTTMELVGTNKRDELQ